MAQTDESDPESALVNAVLTKDQYSQLLQMLDQSQDQSHVKVEDYSDSSLPGTSGHAHLLGKFCL